MTLAAIGEWLTDGLDPHQPPAATAAAAAGGGGGALGKGVVLCGDFNSTPFRSRPAGPPAPPADQRRSAERRSRCASVSPEPPRAR